MSDIIAIAPAHAKDMIYQCGLVARPNINCYNHRAVSEEGNGDKHELLRSKSLRDLSAIHSIDIELQQAPHSMASLIR